MKPALLVAAAATCGVVRAFAPAAVPAADKRHLSVRSMGLFDGMKEAFGSDGTGDLGKERETPIDRWMGWNAKGADAPQGSVGSNEPANFVDSMDAANYVRLSLAKPMGIVFEENDADRGGIFVLELAEDGKAAGDGTVRPGDQLVAVGTAKVAGLPFEDALGRILESSEAEVDLTFFRGPAQFLYGATGASQEWLEEFVQGDAKAAAAK